MINAAFKICVFITNLVIGITIFINLSLPILAMEDPLQTSIKTLNKACLMQSTRIRIASENLANAKSFMPDHTPYRRKIVIVKNNKKRRLDSKFLTYKIKNSKLAFNVVYEPMHPFADKNGLVKYPNVRPEIERADILEAQRSYEANLTVIDISNSLINKTLEIFK